MLAADTRRVEKHLRHRTAGPVGRDHLVEQLPPIETWGKQFATSPLATRTRGDTFRILAQQNNTEVRINGSLIATLDAGKFLERILTAASIITASKPVLVAQYSNSSSFDGVTSDPFMMLIPPTEQFLRDYTLSTPSTGIPINFANLVAPSAAVGSMRLDGTPVPASPVRKPSSGRSTCLAD